MRTAMVGCGYVADNYVTTLANHPELELVGITDHVERRAIRFVDHHDLRRFASYDDLLSHPDKDIVLNLTNPRSHLSDRWQRIPISGTRGQSMSPERHRRQPDGADAVNDRGARSARSVAQSGRMV